MSQKKKRKLAPRSLKGLHEYQGRMSTLVDIYKTAKPTISYKKFSARVTICKMTIAKSLQDKVTGLIEKVNQVKTVEEYLSAEHLAEIERIKKIMAVPIDPKKQSYYYITKVVDAERTEKIHRKS